MRLMNMQKREGTKGTGLGKLRRLYEIHRKGSMKFIYRSPIDRMICINRSCVGRMALCGTCLLFTSLKVRKSVIAGLEAACGDNLFYFCLLVKT